MLVLRGGGSPPFPVQVLPLSKPRATTELFCSKGEQEGGWIRKNFILVFFFHWAMSYSSPTIALRLTRLLARPSLRAADLLLSVCLWLWVRGRALVVLGGCGGRCSAKLYRDDGCGLEQHRRAPAAGNISPFGTWLWHPDLPTFHNPQMEKWHLK